ncbi:hypothetical protein [Taibaiella soli]|uniref:Uncharacterized protein n=1 Tax=Taibaiella soli TaxID=1649169 RepID=A0A2W2B1L7_9BACT|nr:hypothetical protein [Taibaiella soli]PZF73898.1 hypothetical protein DN068_06030 [Taibaiella soli]
MVRVTEDKLIIEIKSDFPALLLRDLQESLLSVLQRRSDSSTPEAIDDVNCLELLKALLPETEAYERSYEA